MKNVSREKAALGIFILLALAGLAALIAYIVGVGHSLNVAASNIDEAAGNLDDYTAILYDGTAHERNESVVRTVDDVNLQSSLSSHVLNQRSTQGDTEASTTEVSAEDASDSAQSEQGQGQKPVAISVFSLQKSYVQKNASVFTLDLKDLTQYNTRTIVRAGKYTFGIFSIDDITAQEDYFQRRVADYEAAQVDFIICVVSDLSLMDSYRGVDMVISAQNEGLEPNGVSVDGVFYDDAAMVGQVGSILISPSRTITARDVASL